MAVVGAADRVSTARGASSADDGNRATSNTEEDVDILDDDTDGSKQL